MRPWVHGYRQLGLASIVVAAISFGCSSSQQRKDDGPANRPANDATESAAPAVEEASFAGTWERDDGLVLLVSDDGSKVEGVFQSAGGAGAFDLYSLSLERTAPDKLSGSAFWRRGELSAATNWEVSRLDKFTLLARVEYVDMDPEAGNRIVNRGWREREIHFEPTAEAVAEAAAAEAAAAAAEEAAAKVAAEEAAAKVAAEEAAVAAAAEEAALAAAAEAAAAEEAAAAAKAAAEEAAAKAAAEEAAIVAAAKAAAEEVAIAAAAKEAELAAAKAAEERAAKEAELAAAAAEERAAKEAELAAAKEAELAAAKEAELAAAKEAELAAAKEAELKRIAEEAEAARIAEAAEAKRIAEEAEAARIAEAAEAKRIAEEAEAARLAAAEEAKRIAAEAAAEAARLAAAEAAAAQTELSVVEAIRSLDTWGQAFFGALKSGDSAEVEAFVLDEADCVNLLGPTDGKAMAQTITEAHRETFAPLLKQHPDISRGQFKEFRHDAPEAMAAGEEGLIVDTKAIWEATLVYEVDGQEKSFPIFNLLETAGSWKAVQLAPPE